MITPFNVRSTLFFLLYVKRPAVFPSAGRFAFRTTALFYSTSSTSSTKTSVLIVFPFGRMFDLQASGK